MDSITCPFCNMAIPIGPSTAATYYLNSSKGVMRSLAFADMPCLEVQIISCPNNKCRKDICIASGRNGYIENKISYIYPRGLYRCLPECVPETIRNDYHEACTIKDDSPKASATLMRRCLQTMIRDIFKDEVRGRRNLSDEIDAIKDSRYISPSEWAAIDSVRSIGNIGAHMKVRAGLIVDIYPGEADILIQLIERLIQKWYIEPEKDRMLYDNVIAIKNEKVRKKVKLFNTRTSAGPGSFIFDDTSFEWIYVYNDKCDFAVPISGDSMEPKIPDKSIVLVRHRKRATNSIIGLFDYNNEAYCKIYVENGQEKKLISANEDYEDIIIDPKKKIKFLGEVLEYINADKIEYAKEFMESP